MSELLNRLIVGHLAEAAELLRRQRADPRYVRAYTLAASSIRHWPISMAVMYQHRGVDGLEEVPGVGPRIARVIRELLTSPAANGNAVAPSDTRRDRERARQIRKFHRSHREMDCRDGICQGDSHRCREPHVGT
ncbi:MAG TPA: helix-hairpin-helix domain-containing protein [Vicinamibacterales bacterium]|nr:helix-hairpin-helix domain-containing protein [Vicinamibacterales bacterium]